MKKLYLFLLLTLLLPYFSSGKSPMVERNDSKKTVADAPFITVWNLSYPGSPVSNGTASLTFGVAVAGVVNYTWRATDNSTNGSGIIANGNTTAIITALPANKTIELSIEPTNFRRINISNGTDRQRLTDVKQWVTVTWSSMQNAFYGCSNLNITATDVPNLSEVTNMSQMFINCTVLNGPANIGSWNVANVTNMSYMFYYASFFNQNIGNWNTSKVTNMESMFYSASAFNQNLGNWNVGNVTNMFQMFANASSFNQPIGNWNVAKVTSMQSMFYDSSTFNQNLGDWTLNIGVNLVGMLSSSKLDCANYSATLMGWAANPATPSGRSLGATGRTYGTNATTVRNVLVSTKGWTITGDTAGAVACGTIPISANANNVLYVNTNVTGGDGSGNSWTNAIKELADALKWANTNKTNFATTPLQIWVAKGTYKPMYRPDTFAGPNITDRNNSFLMVNNVKLYGGFAGTETTLAQRNLGNMANATILSGDYNDNDVVAGTGATLTINNNGENAMHVVGSFGDVGVAELNGFVIKAGNANISTPPNFKVNGYDSYFPVGGGNLMNTSSPTIQNCIFKENSAINAGGAMALYPSSSRVINSLFVDNLATNSSYGGGAILSNSSQGVFVNCTITGNRGANGGAMYNNVSPQPKIYNTIIYGNSSGINNTTGNNIQNSLIQGITTTTNGNINGSTDPLFTNASTENFRLQSTSPVIDKGSNTLYNANGGNLSTDKDLAGNSRLNSTTIDMGAYEYTVVTVPAPTAAAIQIYAGDGTIADLTATGDNLKWYAVVTGGTPLAPTTALTDNTRYYVSQTVSSVESIRNEVLAKRISDDAQTFCGTATVGNLVATPLPGNSVSWYSVSSGGTALANNAPLVSGDYYVEMRSSVSPIQIASGFSSPRGVAVANDGKIWVANRGGTNIQQLDANGNVLATKSGFSNPFGINIQKDGRLLVSDWGTSRILRTDVNGDNPVAVGTGFDHAFRAVEQANGKLLVADTWNHIIKRMDADGANIIVLATGFDNPASVAEDKDANIWVADWGNNAIKKINSDGSGVGSIGTGISQPYDLKIDALGRIVFTQVDGKLRRMNPDGSNLETLYTFASDNNNLAIESNGSILVTEAITGKLYRLSSAYTTNRVKVRVTVNNFGAIAYVDKNVTGGNKSGSSWANASPELADVMRCARTQYDANNTIYDTTPLKVFVAKGTYKPLYNAADGQYKTDGGRNNAFVIVKNVQLYGGFDPANGIDDLTDTRIFGASGSVLSGDYNDNDVITGTGSTLSITGNGENAVHVLISTGAVGVAELNGFVLKGGNADGTTSQLMVNNYASYTPIGGGILMNTSSPTIQNCIFKDNSAFSVGGAMALYPSSSKIINSLFVNNLVTYSVWGGGAIINSQNTNQPIFISCTITGNRATYGGALYNNESSNQVKIYNTVIYGNSSGINNTTNNDIRNSLIQDLSSTTNGNINGSTNPLFVNPSSGDYRLQPTSPVIDKGNNIIYSANGGNLNTNKDLTGNNRLSECTIDMGAYEYQNPDTYINWDGTSWSNTSGPTQSLGACINNNYNLASNFTAKNLKVLNGSINIKPNNTVKIYGNITQSIDNQIVLENDANLIQTSDNAVNTNHKISVKRDVHMRQLDYTYWGTPVSNQKLLNDDAINDGFSVGTPKVCWAQM